MTQQSLIFDVSVRKHHGNQHSVRANTVVQKDLQRKRILELIAEKRRCIHDLREVTGWDANRFSGRLTELKAMDAICEVGTCKHSRGAAIYRLNGGI